ARARPARRRRRPALRRRRPDLRRRRPDLHRPDRRRRRPTRPRSRSRSRRSAGHRSYRRAAREARATATIASVGTVRASAEAIGTRLRSKVRDCRSARLWPTSPRSRSRGRLPQSRKSKPAHHTTGPQLAIVGSVVLEKPVATSTSPIRILALALAGLAGCYTASFDETRPDVYYCVDNNDCLANQACEQFRCVSDDGPKLRLTLPEPKTLVSTT